MANYQSIQRRFNRPTSSINHAYIDATLKDKQNTIDSNFGLLQESVDKTLGQDLIRESDREYLKDKVKGVLNTLDRTDQIKFDSKKAKFSIQDALSEAAKDPEILKQLANTKKIRQIQAFHQERAKKGDLNQQNFQYAYKKSGIDSYLKGEEDGVRDFQYLEYVDVDAKMDEAARKLKAANPNEEVSIQNPLTGEMVTKKVSMITPEEMRNYLRVQLNSNDLKQLEIDGSMMYGMDDSAAISHRDSLIENNNKKIAGKISMLKKYKKEGNLTKSEAERIDNQVKNLAAEKSFFERNLIGQKTAEAIGGQQLIENKIDLFSKIYTKNGPESIEYDSDFLKRMRDANALSNINANLGVSPNISTITSETLLPEDVDPYSDSLSRIDKTLRENSNYLNKVFIDLSDDKKDIIRDTMDQIKNDPEILSRYKGQPISNETLQLETINRLGAKFFPPDVAQQLRSKISSTQAIQKGIEKTTTEFIKAKALEDDTFDQVFKEEEKLTMATPKGDINMQEFLKSNGVTDKETYKAFVNSDSKEAKQFRATLALQSMSLTNDVTMDDFSMSYDQDKDIRNRFKGEGLVGTTNVIDLSESEYRIMRQSAHDLTGESVDETYDVVKQGDNYRLSLKNPDTNFSKIINRTNDLYQLGRRESIGDVIVESVGFDIDRTVRNESSLRGLYSEGNYKKFASKNLDYLDNTVVGNNLIRVQGDLKKEVDPVYKDILREVSNAAAFDLRAPIDIYKKGDGSLLVMQESTSLNEDGDLKTKMITGEIQANDVSKMPNFNSQVELQRKENTFKNLEDVQGNIDSISFVSNNRDQVEGLNRLYNKEIPLENMFRKLSSDATAEKLIFTPDVNRYMAFDNPIRLQFKDFVTNTQDYKLNFTKGIDSDYQVLIETKEGESVGSVPLNKDIPVEIFEKAYQGTPQVFLSLFTQLQVKKYKDSIISNGR